MKIVYFYQYFSTPRGSWGTRVYEITKNWVDQGHEVCVVTSVYAKSDLKADRFIENQVFDGIKVKVINVLIDNKQSTVRRIFSFLQFLCSAFYYSLTMKGDKFIVSSGPITVGILGIFLKWRRKDVTLEVRDIWPDTAIEMGVIKNSFLIGIAKRLELFLYRKMDRVVALSPGMESEVLERGAKKATSIPNIANLELFYKDDEGFQKRTKNYAIYYGNLGAINNSDSLVEIARMLHENGSDFEIMVIGDGPMAQAIREASELIPNLNMKGLMPKNELVSHVQKACYAFVPLANTPILNTSSPNKLFEALACGVPVVQNTTGWIKNLLDDHEVGYTFHSKDHQEMANLLLSFKEEETYLDSRDRCRKLAEEKFDKNVLAQTYLDFISE